MTDSPIILSRRQTLKPVIIATLIFLAVGLSAGAAVYWWQGRQISAVHLSEPEQESIEQRIDTSNPDYQPGEKTIVLTERELNGLLHLHTQLGDSVKLELAKDAIHARVKTELDPDFPVLGGKTVRAKARFLVDTGAGSPEIIFDDLTVYGISLPNAWLGDLKGKNLLATLGGSTRQNAFAQGIDDISIFSGEIHIHLAD